METTILEMVGFRDSLATIIIVPTVIVIVVIVAKVMNPLG